MGFSFAAGFKTDPVITYIHKKFGDRYLADLGILPHPDYKSIPVHTLPDTSAIALLENLSATVARVQEKAPWPSFIGSNSWVVAPGKSKSGHVLFSNDTHMAHTLPATWFEMHVEAPGLSLYGNFLPGLPFPLIAHTRHHSVGLTMLENDDMDLYKETTSPDHPGHTLWNEEWVPMVTREETIQVKGKPNVQFQVFTTPNGILINDVIAPYQNDPLAPPVSLWWIYHRFPNRLLEANYLLTTAKNPGDAAYAASLIAAPGLNVMYGDKAGNIAWWATAKLPVRPAHVNPNLLLDGTSNKDHPVSYLDFTQNPHAVNPPWGYVYSANNQPDSAAGMLHPGYYLPGDRAQRITSLLDSLGQMDVAAMSQMITDDRSEEIVAQLEVLVPALAEAAEKSPLHRSAYDLLRSWQGTHGIQEIGPVIYNKLLYHIIKGAMADELGTTFFEVFLKQHAFKTTVPILLKNSQSAWWDHHLTPETETREMVIAAAFDTTLIELSAQLGEDPAGWRWGKVHTLELGHPLGIIKPLNLLFNVGPVAVPGSNEVINNLGFTLNGEGIYKVTYGPAMRIVLDFADVEQSESVIPSGQSGHFNSPHYQDQFTLYTQNKFRRQLMNRTEIEQSGKRLVLVPTP
jgi:penicillin amidase